MSTLNLKTASRVFWGNTELSYMQYGSSILMDNTTPTENLRNSTVLFQGHSLVDDFLRDAFVSWDNQAAITKATAQCVIIGSPSWYLWDNSSGAKGVDSKTYLVSPGSDFYVYAEVTPLNALTGSAGSPSLPLDYGNRWVQLAWANNTKPLHYAVWPDIRGGTSPYQTDSGMYGDDVNPTMTWRPKLDLMRTHYEGIVGYINARRPTGSPQLRLVPADALMAELYDQCLAGNFPGVSATESAFFSTMFSDHIHLTSIGKYAVACLHYASIYKQTPVGLSNSWVNEWSTPYSNMPTTTQATFLQQIAWQVATTDRLGTFGTYMSADPYTGYVDPGDSPRDSNGHIINPSVSFNLNGVTDWNTENPFIDVFKTSREWMAHLSGQFGGYTYDDMIAAGDLDANGWPIRIPAGCTHYSTFILTEFPSGMTSAVGRYRLTYDGIGTIVINGGSNVVNSTNQIDFDYTPTGSSMITIDITAINLSTPITNIQVVHHDNLTRHSNGEIFNPVWISKIKDARTLRFMDWMRTNDSTQSTWANRPKVSDYSWGTRKGVPLKVMVALANEVRADPWFCIPHLATMNYVYNFAKYVHDNLATTLKAHFEYSNEVWNWQFGQAQWANTEGLALWPGQADAWVQYYAGRAVQMARNINTAYGANISRAVKIITTQTGYRGLEDAILEAPNWLTSDGGTAIPATYFDAYAITGYFDGGLGRGTKPTVVHSWLSDSLAQATTEADNQSLVGAARTAYIEAHKYDLAVANAFTEIRTGSITSEMDGTVPNLLSDFTYHKNVANTNNLGLVMYEGGTHLVGIGNTNVEDTALTDFFIHCNNHYEMGETYLTVMSGWKDAGGQAFVQFNDVGRHSKYGSWGSIQHLDDVTPRMNALITFSEENPGWWETRSAGTFASSSRATMSTINTIDDTGSSTLGDEWVPDDGGGDPPPTGDYGSWYTPNSNNYYITSAGENNRTAFTIALSHRFSIGTYDTSSSDPNLIFMDGWSRFYIIGGDDTTGRGIGVDMLSSSWAGTTWTTVPEFSGNIYDSGAISNFVWLFDSAGGLSGGHTGELWYNGTLVRYTSDAISAVNVGGMRLFGSGGNLGNPTNAESNGVWFSNSTAVPPATLYTNLFGTSGMKVISGGGVVGGVTPTVYRCGDSSAWT